VTAKKIPVVRKRNICLLVAQINEQTIVAVEQQDLGDFNHRPDGLDHNEAADRSRSPKYQRRFMREP
jgi:hypothetical protein